jgi:16S rRNA (uracil1498-N3)-methyltransferase
VAIGAVECVERPSRGLTLATAVLAGGAMDPVVQKAVELGVEQFIPVCCDRSQLGRKRAQSRMGHWVRLARQTLKQCHRPWAMSLLSPMNLADLLMEVPQGHGVVAHRGGRTIGELSLPTEPVLLVGPEGGFTAQEEAALGERAWQRLRLGRHVLRASTAAVAGAAVLVHGHG